MQSRKEKEISFMIEHYLLITDFFFINNGQEITVKMLKINFYVTIA